MSLTMHSAADRPDLWERGIPSESVWPEYNLHGDVLNRWWGHLDEDLPEFQFVLHDDASDEVVAEGHTGPLWWDGLDETLPDGIDAVIEQIFSQVEIWRARRHTVCVGSRESARRPRPRPRGAVAQGHARHWGTSRTDAFDRLLFGSCQGALSAVDHRPLCPVASTRRAVVRSLDAESTNVSGARVSTPLPKSLLITGTVDEWESWTSMAFP